MGGEGGRQTQLPKPPPTQAPQPCPSVRAQEAAASAQCTRKGVDEGTRPAAELLFSPKPRQKLSAEESQHPQSGYSVSPSALRLQEKGKGKGKKGLGGAAKGCPLLPMQEAIFSPFRSSPPPDQMNSPACTCTRVSESWQPQPPPPIT